MLRVGFDMTPALVGATGVARYTHELAGALERSGVELRRYSIARAPRQERRSRHLRVPRRVVERSWRMTRMPRVEWIVPGVDVVHATDCAPPPSRRPTLVTVHDVAAIDHPELHPPIAIDQQRRQLAGLSRASLVLAVSETTSKALRCHGVPADRIVVTPLGFSPPVLASDPPVPRSPFLLAVGELHPRKGLDVLIRALARSGTRLSLVLAGPGDPTQLRNVAKECGVGSDVSFLGRVEDPVLAGLYRDALLLCAPSRAEGFGLPVLEALGSGLPVIASDLDVVREVAGGAAVLVPAGDAAALAVAITRLSASPDERDRLSAAGRTRAASFTWERTAALTIDAYRRALRCR